MDMEVQDNKKYYFIPLKIKISEKEYNDILEKGPDKLLEYGITGINQAKYYYELLENREGLIII